MITLFIVTWNENRRIHLENNHIKIKTLEEIEILKAASSEYLLNDVIGGQSDPIYELLPTSVIWTPRSTAQAKQLSTNAFYSTYVATPKDLTLTQG